MARSTILTRTPREHPHPWVIISRQIVGGMPTFNRHTLAESAPTEEAAILYAERRAQQGYWVDVYREHHYFVPALKEN